MEEKSVEVLEKRRFLLYYEKYMLVIGILGQAFFYAQGVTIFLNKSALDLSLFGFVIAFVTVSSWCVYGVIVKDKILIISNAVAALGALFVVIGILMYGI